MKLNIPLIKSSNMFCIESAAASFSTSIGRHYEMMFFPMFGFNFDIKQANQTGVCGRYISSGYTNDSIISKLRYYHGISVDFQCISEKILNNYLLVNDNLNRKFPVILYPTGYLCNWINKNLNEENYILIIGYDDEQYYCLDIHHNLTEVQSIQKNLLQNYFVNKGAEFSTFSIISEERPIPNVSDYYEYYFKEYTEKYTNQFDEIKELACFFEKDLDFKLESEGYTNPFDIPLLKNIVHLKRGRYLLSSMFDYMYLKTNDITAMTLSNSFKSMGAEWAKVWSLLIKNFYIEDSNSNVRDIISKYLQEIAEMEKKMQDCLLGKNKSANVSFIPAANTQYVDFSKDKILQANIIKYLNNTAFESNSKYADLTGHNEYYKKESFPYKSEILYSGIKFKIQKDDEGHDNIKCLQQKIPIQKNYYSSVLILGIAEWGDVFDYVNLVYSDGTKDKLLISFPDWYKTDSKDEGFAWKGKIFGALDENDYRGMYCLSFNINSSKQVDYLELPKKENMHIFSISLVLK